MTELQRYLAEEVAEDHADGIITRREAMRRLGLLGLGAATASSLLTASPSAARARRSRAAHTSSSDGGKIIEWAQVPTEAITFPGPRVTLMGAWAPASEPRGGVLVIHENRGLTDHIRSVAGRLAAVGYSALAIDLLSEEGGTGAFSDEAEIARVLGSVDPERFDEDMQAGVTELRRRLRRKKLAATGFCFGGGMVWRLLASGERRLSAAAPFYGPFPEEDGSLKGSKAAVLAIYGGLDSRVNATRDAAQAALEAARLEHEIVTFAGADHAFFNDTGPRFNVAAAAEAYRQLIVWFDRFLAKGEDDDDRDDDDRDKGDDRGDDDDRDERRRGRRDED
jgi:carboxymethylenebutenolidase